MNQGLSFLIPGAAPAVKPDGAPTGGQGAAAAGPPGLFRGMLLEALLGSQSQAALPQGPVAGAGPVIVPAVPPEGVSPQAPGEETPGPVPASGPVPLPGPVPAPVPVSGPVPGSGPVPASGPAPGPAATFPAPRATARLSGAGVAAAAAVLTGRTEGPADGEASPASAEDEAQAGADEPTGETAPPQVLPQQPQVPAEAAPLPAQAAVQAAQVLTQTPAPAAPVQVPAPNQQAPDAAPAPAVPAEVPNPQLEAFVKQATARVQGNSVPQTELQQQPAQPEAEAEGTPAQPRFADLIKLVAQAEGSQRQAQAPAEANAGRQPQTQQQVQGQQGAPSHVPTPARQTAAEPPERPLKAEPKAEAPQAADVKLTQAPARPDEVTQPESARPVPAEPVVRQVSRFIKVMVDSQRSEVRLNLHPEQLGSVAVKLVLEGAQVKASLTAQDAAVKQVLEANLDQLKTRLADQGLHVTEVHVTVGDDGGFGQPQQSHQGSQQKQPNEQQGRPAFRQTMPEEEAATPDPNRSNTPVWARRWMGSRINSLA